MTLTLDFEHMVEAPERERVMERRAVVPSCELNCVFEQAMALFALRFPNKYVAPVSESELRVRVSAVALRRVIGLIFEALDATGLWGDGEELCLSPIICKCLSGYGAVLEFNDESVSLPSKLVSQLAQRDSTSTPGLAGWQLLKARDRIERNGGRMHVASPITEHSTGTLIQLFLPLAKRSVQSARAEACTAELAAI